MKSALVVIDVQRDAMATCPAAEQVLTTINSLIADARQHDVPVVFVQHQGQDLPVGEDGWRLDGRLDYRATDTVIPKEFRDAFAETRLDEALRHSSVSRSSLSGSTLTSASRPPLCRLSPTDTTSRSSATATQQRMPY